MDKHMYGTHIIQFSATNYRSIRDTTILSMASNGKSSKNTFYDSAAKSKLLKSAIIYGANASGKSNLVRGIHFLRNVLLGNLRPFRNGVETDPSPFMFDNTSMNKTTKFEIHVTKDERLYIYSIEFDHARSSIHSETLRVRLTLDASLATVYERVDGSVSIPRTIPVSISGISTQFKTLVESNAPFVTTLARLERMTIAHDFYEAIDDCTVINSLAHEYIDHLEPILDSKDKAGAALKDSLIKFLAIADTSIVDLAFRNINGNKVLFATHSYQSKDDQSLHYKDLQLDEESAGTQKLIQLSAPMLQCLYLGQPLIVDELDSKLHPVLTRYILELFNQSATNSQLIMTSHDSTLMDDEPGLSTDQIYFIERDNQKASELYSLADFPEVTNATRNLSKKYISGAFGANPNIPR